MKGMGFILLIAGFLAATFVASLDVQAVDWPAFAIGAALAVAGVLTIKRAESGHARSATVLENNKGELRESIDNVVRDTEALRDDALTGTALRDAIDNRLRNDLRRFADARESMVHLYGLQVYADIMSSFAAGERYINRVWSASADGYDAEAATYLAKAATQFADARSQLSAAAS
ncbi:MAG: hypothetical protein QNJ00_13640 [Woeseiaceae bacterium]|nr:hypothetical protein [Woeseiaceae bacterium]